MKANQLLTAKSGSKNHFVVAVLLVVICTFQPRFLTARNSGSRNHFVVVVVVSVVVVLVLVL